MTSTRAAFALASTARAYEQIGTTFRLVSFAKATAFSTSCRPKPRAAQLRRHFHVVDVQHADVGAREFAGTLALAIDSQDEFVNAVEFFALDRDVVASGSGPAFNIIKR